MAVLRESCRGSGENFPQFVKPRVTAGRVTSNGRNRGLGKRPVPVSGVQNDVQDRIALIVTASALVFGVAGAPIAMASDSMSTDSTGHMMKPHIGMMKGHAMKGGAMKA